MGLNDVMRFSCLLEVLTAVDQEIFNVRIFLLGCWSDKYDNMWKIKIRNTYMHYFVKSSSVNLMQTKSFLA